MTDSTTFPLARYRPTCASKGDAVNEFSRTVRHRQTLRPGALRAPSAEELAWMERMTPARTRVPKWDFRYRNMQEANADWKRWQAGALSDSTEAQTK